MKTVGWITLKFCITLSVLVTSCAPSPLEKETEQATPTTTTTTTPSTATPAPTITPPGWIVFIGPDGNIFTHSPSEGVSTAITDDASRTGESFIVYTEPTWRPHIEDITFIRSDFSTETPERFAIQYRAPNGDDSRTIYEAAHPPFYLDWSPSGSFLSFLASTESNALSFQVLDPEGELIIEDQGQPYYWDWAGDDGPILSHVGGSTDENPEGARLSLSSESMAGFEDLSLLPLRFQAPAFSPDGSHVLAPLQSLEGTRGLFILDDGGEIVSKVMLAEEFITFDWSPTGETIAVNTGPMTGGIHLGELSLFAVEDLTDPVLQDVIDEGVAAFWWSPKGDRLVYFKPELLPTFSSQPISTEKQTEEELFMQIYLYDLAAGQSEALVSFQPTVEFLRILRFYDQYQRSSTVWSPDGNHIVYTATLGDGTPGVYILPVEPSGSSQFVGEGMHAFWSWE